MSIRPRKKRHRGSVSKVPMAPMIDMVFLLLVFFMTASAMSQGGAKVELDLPESLRSEVDEDLSGRLTISLDASGEAFLGNQAMDREALRLLFKERRSENPALKLRIRADRSVPFLHVKRVMRLAAEQGVESYLFGTHQGEGA